VGSRTTWHATLPTSITLYTETKGHDERTDRMPAEFIYEGALEIKQVTEYGVALGTLLSGAKAPPAEGARFDVHVEGNCQLGRSSRARKRVWTTSTCVPTAVSSSTSTPRLRPRTARKSRSSQMAYYAQPRISGRNSSG